MNRNSNFFQKNALLLFLILTPLLGNAFALLLPLPIEVVVLLAALVPTILAVLLVGIGDGRKGLGLLLRKPFQWRISTKWYFVALALPLVIQVSVNLLGVLFEYIPAFQFNPPTIQQIIVGVVILIWAVLEELGWRGFALPGLLARRSALSSAVVIGFFWGAFHLGIGLLDGRPLIPTFLIPFAGSIILTWLFVQTKGNLLMVILTHFGFNFFPMFFGEIALEQALWLQVIVYLVTAFILIVGFGSGMRRSSTLPAAVLDPA
jgi:membrane protease YdiL (CAAX protease family)